MCYIAGWDFGAGDGKAVVLELKTCGGVFVSSLTLGWELRESITTEIVKQSQ